MMPYVLECFSLISSSTQTGSYVHEFSMQGAIQGVLGAQAYLKANQPCVQLTNNWTVVGASDGGFTATAVAAAIEKMGNVPTIFLNAAFLDSQYQNRFIFGT